MTPLELEEIAADVRQLARVAPDTIVSARVIADRVLGAGAVDYVPRLSATGMLSTVRGKRRIFVRAGERDANFIVAHELGHWALERIGATGLNEELAANRIAASLIAPHRAVLKAHRWDGENLAAIGQLFRLSQSSVWFRLSEVLHDNRALYSPSSEDVVRVRSFGGFEWPDLDVVERWARGRTPKGIAKTRLTDDRRRVTLKTG